jgi:protein dithiol:quinone oxidoreductase
MPLSTRAFFALLTVISLVFLAAGLVLGEMARLHPCYLCNFQRLLYLVLAVIALGGIAVPAWRKLWSVLVGLTALGGMATAIYQSWMQYAPDLATECGVGKPTLLEQIVDWLGMRWPSMFMVTGFCTDKDWVFLGLSLANWSVLCFALLLAGAVWLLLRRQPS